MVRSELPDGGYPFASVLCPGRSRGGIGRGAGRLKSSGPKLLDTTDATVVPFFASYLTHSLQA